MASLEALSTFDGGMQSDANKFTQPQNSYLEALNFRLIGELGFSNHALVNIKGNEYKTTINNTYASYKITVGTFNLPVSITINSNTSTIFITNNTTSGLDIYNIITTISGFNITFFASYYEDSCIVWSEIFDVNPILSSAGLQFITQYTQVGTHYWVAPQSNLIPIGSTYIRDDIYIFTTPQTSVPNTLSNAGQIYKLLYDVVSKIATLKLIYNNYVNFNTRFPIPPTGTHGRFESDTIQRLYWTDNFNKLRSCNATDPNLMALPVALLDIFPSINSFIPTLKKVQMTGSLQCGIYQYAYRLKKSNGQITLWSELSLPIAIYNNIDENTYTNGVGISSWDAYVGNSTTQPTSKSVTCTIKKVDDNFDFVDVCFIYRNSYNDIGNIEIFNQSLPISSGNPITFTHFGSEVNNIQLTLPEFLVTSPGFTHCKTIDTKDNRLFAGNVRVEQADLIYDARAYQFPTGSLTTNLVDKGNTQIGITIPQLDILAETHDAINYSTTSTFYTGPSFGSQRFYPGTSIPGGQGPNIEFKMKSWAIEIDTVAGADFHSFPGKTPWKHTNQLYIPSIDNPGINLGVDQVDYPVNAINDSLKTVYKSFLLRGYTPNEIYRFGIQFFDKQGSPYFVKWICDIVMPNYNDNYPTFGRDGSSNLTLSFGGTYTPIGTTSGIGYMQMPYLEFQVNINGIEDKISGFEIVRCERTENDRFIAGTGLMYQTQYDGAVATINLPATLDQAWTTAGEPAQPDMYIDTQVAQAGGYKAETYTFDCWDWETIGNVPPLDFSLDRIHTCGTVQRVNTALVGYTALSGVDDGYGYSKFYAWGNINNGADFKLVDGKYLGRDATYASPATQAGGLIYQNYTTNTATGGYTHTDGNPTFFMVMDQPYAYNQYHGGVGGPYKIFCEYRKYGRLDTQYGGRTYGDRANSTYISTGMYVPINDKTFLTPGVTIISSLRTFGGDTFYDIFVKSKGDKNLANYGSGIESYIHYNPHIGYHNTAVRNGVHFDFPGHTNNKFIGESFSYETVYSIENNVRKFFPKPLLFNNNKQWDNRVWYSEVKINGEVEDSWEMFKPNNYWDVEGSYGPINSLIAFNDTLYYIQKKAFGKLYVNPMALISTGNIANSIVTGLGNTIQRHDYISTDVGTNHQWSVTRSPHSLLFVDSTNKKVIKYGAQGIQSISDTHGQKNTFVRYLHDDILINDNPILKSGIHCTYDYYHDEYLITLLNEYTRNDNQSSRLIVTSEFNTISFNEKVDRWNSFYSFTPHLYLNNRTQLWSPNPTQVNDLYIHNINDYGNFYNSVFPSTIKLVTNQNGKYTKLFNNLIFNTEVILDSSTSSLEGNTNIFDNTFDRFRAYNDYQNTDWTTLVPNGVAPTVRRMERQWNLQIPRNKVLYSLSSSPNIFTDIGTKLYGERLRDKYLTIDLSYNNSNGLRLIFNNLTTKYLISDR